MERPVAHSCKNGDKSHSTAKLVEQVLISRSPLTCCWRKCSRL